MKKVKDKKLLLQEILETQIGEFTKVRLLWLSELTGLDPSIIISTLEESKFRNKYEVVPEGGVNWVRRKVDRMLPLPKNEKYVVYIAPRKNKAMIHRINCRVYQKRKPSSKYVYWSDQVLPFGQGKFESLEEAENYARGTGMTDTRRCDRCLDGEAFL